METVMIVIRHRICTSEIDVAQSGHKKTRCIITSFREITDNVRYGLKDMKIFFQDDAW